ncbi:MAG: TolC family protein [Rhodocyclaceae bacterium]|nr:TolC family protein [Rhodocyclaceae bacterium]
MDKFWSVLAGCLIALPAWSAPDLATALDGAWALARGGDVALARRELAAARGTAAASWLPGAPAISVATRSDRLTERRGTYEHELELSLPVWLPGQRAARAAEAARTADETEADLRLARLQLAGEVRTAWWDARLAALESEMAAAAAAALEQLADDVARRVRAGELARSDELAARAEALEAASAAGEATQRAHDARARWLGLTGLHDWPQQDEAPPPAVATGNAALQALEARVAAAEARLDVARSDRRDAPELGLQWRRERGDPALPADDSVRLQVRIPFATQARNAPLEGAARTELARARADQATASRDLALAREAAAARLELSGRLAELARTRADGESERAALAAKAFKLGALGLPEYLRVQAAARAAALGAARAVLERGRARSQLNQALGVTP